MSRPPAIGLRDLAAARRIDFAARPLPVSYWVERSSGARLHYLDWAGGPETLILLHGGALSAHSFDLLALAVGPEVRCIALDLRGHGESDWADNYCVEEWADDLLALVEELGVSRVHVAGMSLGGCIAGHAALALGSKLASIAFIDVADRVNFGASARMRSFMAAIQPVARVEDLVDRALRASPQTDPGLMRYRYQALLRSDGDRFVLKADRRRPFEFAHVLRKLEDLGRIAPLVACPAMIAKGGRSRVLSTAGLHRFAGLFPHGYPVAIPEAGHNVQEDAPVALAMELRALITRGLVQRQQSCVSISLAKEEDPI